MSSKGRTRKEQQQDQEQLYQELEQEKPRIKAMIEFKRKAYEQHDVSSYVQKLNYHKNREV